MQNITKKTSFFNRGDRKTDRTKIRFSNIFSSTWTGPAVPFSKRRTLLPMLMARSFLSSSWLVTDHRSEVSVSICSWNRSQFASRSPCFSDRLKSHHVVKEKNFSDSLLPFSKFLKVKLPHPSPSFHIPRNPPQETLPPSNTPPNNS